MRRPAQPPQVISVGDIWSRDVDILLDGKPTTDARWTHVDAPAGLGIRYVVDGDGKLVQDASGEHAVTEAVHGTFEVRWRDDRASTARPDQG
jgi:hypothetical protein